MMTTTNLARQAELYAAIAWAALDLPGRECVLVLRLFFALARALGLGSDDPDLDPIAEEDRIAALEDAEDRALIREAMDHGAVEFDDDPESDD